MVLLVISGMGLKISHRKQDFSIFPPDLSTLPQASSGTTRIPKSLLRPAFFSLDLDVILTKCRILVENFRILAINDPEIDLKVTKIWFRSSYMKRM